MLRGLLRKGLVYLEVPVEPYDRFAIPPLEVRLEAELPGHCSGGGVRACLSVKKLARAAARVEQERVPDGWQELSCGQESTVAPDALQHAPRRLMHPFSQGFVSNKTSDAGDAGADPLEGLLYGVFVANRYGGGGARAVCW